MSDYIDQEFLDRIDDIFKRIDFLDEKDELLFDSIVKFYEYCFLTKGVVTFLFKICQMYTRRYKEIHKDVERFALMALQVNDHPDAVVYYCLAIIHNNDYDVAKEKLDAVRKYCTNKNTNALVLIFEAAILWRKGAYDEYVSLLRKFFDEKELSFNPYMSIPCSTVWLNEKSPRSIPVSCENKLFQIFNGIDFSVCLGDVAGIDYVVTVSCDSSYFEKYNQFIIDSMAASGDNFLCFIVIADTLELQPEISDSRFVVKQLGLGRSSNIGPISSALRYLAAGKISSIIDKPIVVMDFDCVIKKSLLPLIRSHENKSMALRYLEKEKCLPWQYVTAGFGVFYSNDISRDYLATVEAFLYHQLALDGEQWWVDQNSLEVAGRFVDMSEVSNLFHELPDYTLIPTGSQNAKITRLSGALKEIKDAAVKCN